MRQPWERQTEAGEGEEAFAGFSLYRDLGPLRRSITLVARELDKSRVLVGRWSSRWGWVERASAWDQHLDAQRVDEQVLAVREMARRHAQASDLMTAMWLQRAQQMVNAQQLDEIPAGVLPRWLDVAVRVGRLSRGASTEILAPEGPAAAEAGGRTLAELFEPAPPGGGMTELEVARAITERSQADRPDGDLDSLDRELAELVHGQERGDPDDGGEVDDRAEVPLPEAEAPEPEEPAAQVVPPEPPAQRETLRYVDEGGQRVRRLVPPPAPPPPPPPPQRRGRNGRR